MQTFDSEGQGFLFYERFDNLEIVAIALSY